SLGINSFYSELTNIIHRTTGPYPNKYVNSDGSTTFFGLEVEGKIFITKELMITGSGLLQYNTNGDSVGNMMPVPQAGGKGGISYSSNGFTVSVFNIYEGNLDSRYDAPFNKTREAFDLLNANMKYEISRLFKLKAPVITLEFEGYNLLNQEIWLPATGMPKQFTVPAVQGASAYFGVTLGF
ncbi:MAG: hypothetical protein JW863_04325, partial [Chitinispirillaceae bacterium]|nr:hypothetical protein [Chitinispirillaceae bacterium]